MGDIRGCGGFEGFASCGPAVQSRFLSPGGDRETELLGRGFCSVRQQFAMSRMGMHAIYCGVIRRA
jgi:hypothetical protein